MMRRVKKERRKIARRIVGKVERRGRREEREEKGREEEVEEEKKSKDSTEIQPIPSVALTAFWILLLPSTRNLLDISTFIREKQKKKDILEFMKIKPLRSLC